MQLLTRLQQGCSRHCEPVRDLFWLVLGENPYNLQLADARRWPRTVEVGLLKGLSPVIAPEDRMASQSSSSRGGGMDVDETGRKRDRGEFHDLEDTEETPVPTEMPDPQKPPVTLEDLLKAMHTSSAETKGGIARLLEREMGATKREAQEGKEMAAKATTVATEVKIRWKHSKSASPN